MSCSPSKIMRLRMASTKACERFGRQAVLLGDGGKLGGVLLGLEPLVAGADGGLVEAFARLEACRCSR